MLNKKRYAFNNLYALFPPVCSSLIGRVARYTPSSKPNIRTKIVHKSSQINFEHLLKHKKCNGTKCFVAFFLFFCC